MRNRIYFLTSADLKGHYKPIQASHAVVNAVAVGDDAGKMQKPLVTCAKGPSSAHCLELWKAGQGPWRLSPVLSQTWAIVRLGWGGVGGWTTHPRAAVRPSCGLHFPGFLLVLMYSVLRPAVRLRARVCVCVWERAGESERARVCVSVWEQLGVPGRVEAHSLIRGSFERQRCAFPGSQQPCQAFAHSHAGRKRWHTRAGLCTSSSPSHATSHALPFPSLKSKGGSQLPRNFHGEYQRSQGGLWGNRGSAFGSVRVRVRPLLCSGRANFPATDLQGFDLRWCYLLPLQIRAPSFRKVKLLRDKFAPTFLPLAPVQSSSGACDLLGSGGGNAGSGGGGCLNEYVLKVRSIWCPLPLEASLRSRDSPPPVVYFPGEGVGSSQRGVGWGGEGRGGWDQVPGKAASQNANRKSRASN